MAVFSQALADMDGPFYGPEPFQDYCRRHGVGGSATPRYISVDSLDRLAPELREADTMVLRLGRGGSGTGFGLVHARDDIQDFFIGDDWARGLEPRPFASRLTEEECFAYRALAPLGEKGLVNLAIASGVLADFLGVDEPASRSAPATGGHGTHTFSVRPRADQDHAWMHTRGQVEVDALYAGRRDGRRIMAVLEAKEGRPEGTSLAKHKLLYPWLALEPARQRFEYVPLYVRCTHQGDTASFWLAEVRVPPGEALDGLTVARAGHYCVQVGA